MAHVYPEGCVFNSLDDIAGKKVTVMGLGLNGGGEACVRFFLLHGAFVTVTDMKTREQLLPTINSIENDRMLDKSRLRYVLGEHRMEDFSDAFCVIKNPGVKIEGNKYLQSARAIETDLSIFLKFTKAPIIAVTGSKGKSSTVSAIEYGLKSAGFKVFLGGNITVSPLTFLHKTDGTTPVVLELSSWQLADLRGRKLLKPKISIITKIVPDHQNWYGAMDPYVDDKKLIYADQTEKDFTILDFDEDDYLTETANPKEGCKCWGDVFASETKATVLRYSKKILPDGVWGAYQVKTRCEGIKGYIRIPLSLTNPKADSQTIVEENVMGELLVPGQHMKINVLNAALVMHIMGIVPQLTLSILGQWKGIQHRLERCHDWVCETTKRKFAFYNDTCATVPEATAAATQAFDQSMVLVSGGTDKGLDFDFLAQSLAKKELHHYRPYEIYLLSGTGTDKLTALLDQLSVKYVGPFDSLQMLLGIMKTNMMEPNHDKVYGPFFEKNYIPVVFSPGATSFGMFTNEFDRGNKFKDLVRSIF